MTLPMLTADQGFEASSQVVLEYLEEHVPLALWSVTRVENDRQTFLRLTESNSYGKAPGDSHQWEDSFCIHMTAGRAPTVAPDAQAVPAYAAAGVNAALQIGTYAGAAIREPDGMLFGAICGLDQETRRDDAALVEAAPLLSMLGQLLTMSLAADRARDVAAQHALKATLAAETDSLTNLYNRRAWDRVVAEEAERFRRFADPTVAAMLDLDMLKSINDNQGHAAGDAYIQQAASALRGSVKGTDTVARLGGDEFGLILRHCTEAQAEGAVRRIYAGLQGADVAGSLGWAPITVMKGFPAAIAEADESMYEAKAARRAARIAKRAS